MYGIKIKKLSEETRKTPSNEMKSLIFRESVKSLREESKQGTEQAGTYNCLRYTLAA